MPLIQYKQIRLNDEKQFIIAHAIKIINEFRAQGYDLTLRQLYYQFVGRDLFPASWADPATGSTNNERSYKKLGDIINDARLGGYIDWKAIEDRTRELDGNPHWTSPTDIVEVCSRQFQLDKWEEQEYRVEVWVEKDALEGVVGKAAKALDVAFFSCRGNASSTALWDAGQRLKAYAKQGQTPVILHLGDHDPSGVDMSRDNEERVSLFMDDAGGELIFNRIALNMDQIDTYDPPPNPVKMTDSRSNKYKDRYGDECWELDALEPSVIEKLIIENVLKYRNEKLFNKHKKAEEKHRADLALAANRWDGVAQWLEDNA